MATAFRNPILDEQPFEDYQRSRLPSRHSLSSSDALNVHVDMDKSAPPQKLFRSKSLWARKSVRKPAATADATTPTSSSLDALPTAPENGSADIATPNVVALASSSIVPDVFMENPVWKAKELEWYTISAAAFKASHPIHNPMGPRHYKNHHIIPPHAKRDNRAQSVFSPSFPPMAPSLHTQSVDSSHTPPPSRSPSGSPLQTPNSSQTRIYDPSSKTRSRKTSQSAHDPVDLLDGSDPWGQQWHHQSPYDVGISRPSVEGHESPVSPVNPAISGNNPRPRRLSATAGQSRHKTVAPSPLSQSTSAVHLHSLDANNLRLPRRFSKHRKPFNVLFGTHDSTDNTSPAGNLQHDDKLGRKLSKRRSAAITIRPSSVAFQQSFLSPANAQGDKKERRGSILERLVRRFSIARRPQSGKRSSQSLHEDYHPVVYSEAKVSDVSESQARSTSPEKVRQSKRIPAPALETEGDNTINVVPPALVLEAGNRNSAELDVETPITLGRLTIANPDDPSTSSVTATPAHNEVPLPHHVNISSDDAPSVPSKPTLHLQTAAALENSLPLQTSSPQPLASQEQSLPDPASSQTIERVDTRSEPSPRPISTPVDQVPTGVAPPHMANNARLSRASLLVNPPTPNVQPPKDITSLSRSSHELHTVTASAEGRKMKTSSSGKVRETETFRLVRSPSDHVYPNGETIVADGEQWEVIDTSRSKKITPTSPTSRERSKAQSKENDTIISERDRRRNHKERPKRRSRHRDVEDDADRYQSRSSENGYSRRESRRHEKEKSTWESSNNVDGEVWMREGEKIHNERRSRRERNSHRDSGDRLRPTTSSSSSDGPTRASSTELSRRTDQKCASGSHSRHGSYVEGQKASVSPSNRERRPSLSTRPTSGLPSAAELNNVRAREAWELDRMWKGRSMSLGQEGSNIIASPVSVKAELEHHGNDEIRRSATTHSAGHGSSHTYFVVQTPLQSSSIPVHLSPPPILYTNHSTHSLPFPTSSSPTSSRNANPPPEPIRTTSYQLAPLPPSLASLDDPISREYWAKLAGMHPHH